LLTNRSWKEYHVKDIVRVSKIPLIAIKVLLKRCESVSIYGLYEIDKIYVDEAKRMTAYIR
jgi:predicted transcriptional regulator